MFDGPLARKLNQCSKFGVLLDIVADNLLRSAMWIAAAISSARNGGNTTVAIIACVLTSTEWFTMHANLAGSSDQHWKQKMSEGSKSNTISSVGRKSIDWLKREYVKNNFRNPIGALGVFGLFCSGVFTYGYFEEPVISKMKEVYGIPFEFFCSEWVIIIAYFGRVITFVLEMDITLQYLESLIYVYEGEDQSKANLSNKEAKYDENIRASGMKEECASKLNE